MTFQFIFICFKPKDFQECETTVRWSSTTSVIISSLLVAKMLHNARRGDHLKLPCGYTVKICYLVKILEMQTKSSLYKWHESWSEKGKFGSRWATKIL